MPGLARVNQTPVLKIGSVNPSGGKAGQPLGSSPQLTNYPGTAEGNPAQFH